MHDRISIAGHSDHSIGHGGTFDLLNLQIVFDHLEGAALMWGWGIFLIHFLNSRALWLSGSPAAGKTAFSVRLAYELLRRGIVKHVVSNIPIAFATDPWTIKTDESHRLHTCVILDEGGTFLETGKDLKQYMAFVRKSNIYIIAPSVEPPPLQMRVLTAERVFNLERMGLPGWIFRYVLKKQMVKETEKFYWPQPWNVFGMYDTDARPVDDMGISEWLRHHKEIAVAAYYREEEERTGRSIQRGQRDGVQPMDSSGWFADQILEAAQEFTSAAEALSAFGEKRQRSRR